MYYFVFVVTCMLCRLTTTVCVDVDDDDGGMVMNQVRLILFPFPGSK